jgi:hypothetical protein
MVLASAGMARRLAATIPDIHIPDGLVADVSRDPQAGIDAACDQILWRRGHLPLPRPGPALTWPFVRSQGAEGHRDVPLGDVRIPGVPKAARVHATSGAISRDRP